MYNFLILLFVVVVAFWLEVTYALRVTKKSLTIAWNWEFYMFGQGVAIARNSVWSSTKPNVIIGMYYAPFLIVIANIVLWGTFAFFLALTNFGLTAFELKYPFYTAGINILSKGVWILPNFIYFIILYVFFIHVQTGVYLEHLFLWKVEPS